MVGVGWQLDVSSLTASRSGRKCCSPQRRTQAALADGARRMREVGPGSSRQGGHGGDEVPQDPVGRMPVARTYPGIQGR